MLSIFITIPVNILKENRLTADHRAYWDKERTFFVKQNKAGKEEDFQETPKKRTNVFSLFII